ncbi:hypothetical protein [Psychroserpens algicola]|uniref:Uncharacterized protein n=1 Tax=Psychroserpens algicola TaxID=1719034 RepID=A0ABT0HAT1_9FLAO|nr:hypothetical protein [Psychroserpens algicola]MCK8480952.1 hypothetical protein [Psychroserpens algicola]
MVDIDLHNIQILTSQDIDLVQVSHVKEIESQNVYLKYGLIASGVFVCGILLYLYYHKITDKSTETKN